MLGKLKCLPVCVCVLACWFVWFVWSVPFAWFVQFLYNLLFCSVGCLVSVFFCENECALFFRAPDMGLLPNTSQDAWCKRGTLILSLTWAGLGLSWSILWYCRNFAWSPDLGRSSRTLTPRLWDDNGTELCLCQKTHISCHFLTSMMEAQACGTNGAGSLRLTSAYLVTPWRLGSMMWKDAVDHF